MSSYSSMRDFITDMHIAKNKLNLANILVTEFPGHILVCFPVYHVASELVMGMYSIQYPF